MVAVRLQNGPRRVFAVGLEVKHAHRLHDLSAPRDPPALGAPDLTVAPQLPLQLVEAKRCSKYDLLVEQLRCVLGLARAGRNGGGRALTLGAAGAAGSSDQEPRASRNDAAAPSASDRVVPKGRGSLPSFALAAGAAVVAGFFLITGCGPWTGGAMLAWSLGWAAPRSAGAATLQASGWWATGRSPTGGWASRSNRLCVVSCATTRRGGGGATLPAHASATRVPKTLRVAGGTP
eukprot:CAMPEP_0179024924 /NCGR_PEP_ID=MMETSP0796-20121207/7707_1 /TAXON_ID=73915 /ORGANISM="Pyrodinium bahamense, Strain pbaha01" /LENGTH=233 /DNA_ID=CAMNT_0020720903 /DNA_START=377 /DNA_END=1075 /DNA_ORIENTATION=+